MGADIAEHCNSGEDDSPLRSPVMMTKVASACGSRSIPVSSASPGGVYQGTQAGATTAIAALGPWMMALRGRALGALAFSSERVWIRACLLGWHRLTKHRSGSVMSTVGHCGDLVVPSLASALDALNSFSASPSLVAAGLILRLRHLHNLLGEEWTERLAAEGSESDLESDRMPTARSSVGSDDTSAVFFQKRLQKLLSHWPQALERAREKSPQNSPKAAPRRRRAAGQLDEAQLISLKSAIINDTPFQRLRGALSFASSIWGRAFEATEEAAFKAAAKRALSVLFALDAVTRALPGRGLSVDHRPNKSLECSRLEELPPELLEALQQLGPL